MKRDIFNTSAQARPPFVVAAAAALAVAAVMAGAVSPDDEPAAGAELGMSVTTGTAISAMALAPLAARQAEAAPLQLERLASGVDDRRVAHFQALVQGGHFPRYRWDFGDGSQPQGWTVLSSVQHHYARPGRYTVSLKVVAEGGQVLTHRQELVVPQP